jgi:hypothetical protein
MAGIHRVVGRIPVAIEFNRVGIMDWPAIAAEESPNRRIVTPGTQIVQASERIEALTSVLVGILAGALAFAQVAIAALSGLMPPGLEQRRMNPACHHHKKPREGRCS